MTKTLPPACARTRLWLDSAPLHIAPDQGTPDQGAPDQGTPGQTAGDALGDALAGEPTETAVALAHLATCPACAALAETLNQLGVRAEAVLAPPLAAPDAFLAAARAQFAQESLAAAEAADHTQNMAADDHVEALDAFAAQARAALVYTPAPPAAFVAAARAQHAAQDAVPHGTAQHGTAQHRTALGARRPWRIRAGLAVLAAAAAVWIAFVSGPIAPVHAPQPGQPRLVHSATAAWIDDVPAAAGVTARAPGVWRTGPHGALVVDDPENAVLTLRAGSTLRATALSPAHTALVLEAGTVHARVAPHGPDALFEIRTRGARVVVVGTAFSVTVDAHGHTTVRGEEGKVRVEDATGALRGFVTAGGVLVVPAAPPSPRATAPKPSPQPMTQPTAIPSAPAVAPRATKRVRQARTKAKPAARRIARAPRAPAAVLAQARAWIAGGREADAAALLKAQDAPTWRHDALLADALELLGQPDAAIAAYERALADHDVPALRAALASVQTRHKGPAAGAAAWRAYLARAPRGPEGMDAHDALVRAALAQVGPRTPNAVWADAMGHVDAMYDRAPASLQTAAAFARVAAALLAAKRWTQAEAWFKPLLQSPHARIAETAWVGQVRVDLGLRRRQQARARLAAYRARFEARGHRAADVARLERALGVTAATHSPKNDTHREQKENQREP